MATINLKNPLVEKDIAKEILGVKRFASQLGKGEKGDKGDTGATGATGPAGPQGATGPQGDPGVGLPTGGTAGQILAKDSATDYDVSWKTLEGPYGHMYNDNVNTTVDITSSGVDVEIPSGFSSGLVNGFTFQSSKQLRCDVAGTYLMVYSISGMTASVANKTFEAGILLNGTRIPGSSSHAEVSPGGSNRPEVMSGTVITTLAVNDIISLCVHNHDDTTDLVVNHANLSIYTAQGFQGQTGATGPAGADGVDGVDGTDGVGVPVGGTTGQVLAKNSNTDYDTEWIDQSGGTLALNDLTDVDTTGVTDGQVLTYDSGTSTWIPTTVTAGVIGLISILQFATVNQIQVVGLGNLSSVITLTTV